MREGHRLPRPPSARRTYRFLHSRKWNARKRRSWPEVSLHLSGLRPGAGTSDASKAYSPESTSKTALPLSTPQPELPATARLAVGPRLRRRALRSAGAPSPSSLAAQSRPGEAPRAAAASGSFSPPTARSAAPPTGHGGLLRVPGNSAKRAPTQARITPAASS
jgi:hypothetical protein